METNIALCILIGLPGSGKSTLSNSLKNKTLLGLLRVICISYDEFASLEEQEDMVLKVATKTDVGIFKQSRNQYMEFIESVISSIQAGSFDSSIQQLLNELPCSENHKYLIILDDNFYYRSMRYKVYQLASKYGCGFCQLYLKCEVWKAIERNHKRLDKVKDVVIETMNSKLEPPSMETVSWESESLILTSEVIDDTTVLQNVKEFISKSFLKTASIANPERHDPEQLLSKNVNLESTLHQSDLILRSLVSDKIKALHNSHFSSSSLKQNISLIAQIRSNLLRRIRCSELLIPEHVYKNYKIQQGELRQFLQIQFYDACKSTLKLELKD